MGYSKIKVNRGIKFIIDEGWGHWHKQNLILKSGSQISTLYSKAGASAKHYVKVNNLQDIQVALLKNKVQQKKFITTKISDLKSRSSKVVKAAYKKLSSEKSFVDDGMSVKSVGKVFGVSPSHASRQLKSLAKNGLIKIIKRRQCLGQFCSKLFSLFKEMYKGVYISKGYMYYNISSKITFLDLNNVA